MYRSCSYCNHPTNLNIGQLPINNLKQIKEFSDECYQTSVNFIPDYSPDNMRSSPGGQFCKAQVNQMLVQVGKNPIQYTYIHPPVVNISNPKIFTKALHQTNYNAEEALNLCLANTTKNYRANMCHNAYEMYKTVYEN